jgi:DNA-binding response OmpR family regulator
MMCERCEELQEEVAYLRNELGLQVTASEVYAVTTALSIRPQAARLAIAMYRAGGRLMTNMQMFEAIPQVLGEKFNDDRSTKLVDVQVCNLRKAMGADAIATVWGKGRALTPAGRARIAAILEPMKAAA